MMEDKKIEKELYTFVVLNGTPKKAVATKEVSFTEIELKGVSFVINTNKEEIEMIAQGQKVLWVKSDFIEEAIYNFLEQHKIESPFILKMFFSGKKEMDKTSKQELRKIYDTLTGEMEVMR